MPSSKVIRVRREGFSKSNARDLPESEARNRAGLRLTSRARFSKAWSSGGVRSRSLVRDGLAIRARDGDAEAICIFIQSTEYLYQGGRCAVKSHSRESSREQHNTTGGLSRRHPMIAG